MLNKSIISFLRLVTMTSLLGFLLTSCGSDMDTRRSKMIISVKDQTMLLTQNGKPVKAYKISTSKFGLGDTPRSMRTPLGTMKVAKKIGNHAPSGAVFKSRKRTGEILKPNSPGRDPIVTRIMWLKGTEGRNRNAYQRYIYIHGTPEEWRIGTPASYGCIRMKSRDIIDLYRRIGVGAQVKVINSYLDQTASGRKFALGNSSQASKYMRIDDDA